MSRARENVLVIGNSAVDLVFTVAKYPGPNEKCSALSFTRQAGGQGVNMSLVAARLGAQCRLLSKIGTDPNGELITQTLSDAGIDTSAILREQLGRTPVVSVVVDHLQGTRACVHDKTGLHPPTASEVDLEAAAGTSLLLTDGRYGSICTTFAQVVRKTGGLAVAAIERFTDEALALAAASNVVIVSDSLDLLKRKDGDFATAGLAFSAELGSSLIVTRGATGCVIFSNGSVELIQGQPATVVDTVGAGDAFAAAVAVALNWNWPLRKAAAWGNYVGARSCEGTGTQWRSMPDRPTAEEAEAYLHTGKSMP